MIVKQDIKSQIIDNLDIINTVLNKKISKEYIIDLKIDNSIFDNLIDKNEIPIIINKYQYYYDFMLNENKLYNKLRRLGLLEKYTSNLIRKNVKWCDKLAINIIKSYEYYDDFKQNEDNCYQYLWRNSKTHLLEKLK